MASWKSGSLYLRGSALLLAGLPADPDSDAHRLKVLAADLVALAVG